LGVGGGGGRVGGQLFCTTALVNGYDGMDYDAELTSWLRSQCRVKVKAQADDFPSPLASILKAGRNTAPAAMP